MVIKDILVDILKYLQNQSLSVLNQKILIEKWKIKSGRIQRDMICKFFVKIHIRKNISDDLQILC